MKCADNRLIDVLSFVSYQVSIEAFLQCERDSIQHLKGLADYTTLGVRSRVHAGVDADP